jgi:hypothetical protein
MVCDPVAITAAFLLMIRVLLEPKLIVLSPLPYCPVVAPASVVVRMVTGAVPLVLPRVMVALLPSAMALVLVTVTLLPSVMDRLTLSAPGPWPMRCVVAPLQGIRQPSAAIRESGHEKRSAQ